MTTDSQVPRKRGDHPLAEMLADPERLSQIPIETVERLFCIDRQIRTDDARSEFAVAFAAVQADMTPVRKAARNPSTKSFYATAQAVDEMLDPILVRHGFSCSFSTTDCPIADHIRFILTVRRGLHSEVHQWDAPVDDRGPKGNPTKTRLHGMASSATYVKRHLKCSVFDIQLVADDDGNTAAFGPPKTADSKEIAEVQKLLSATNADVQKFCSHFGIAAVHELTISQARQAKVLLMRKKQKAADDLVELPNHEPGEDPYDW